MDALRKSHNHAKKKLISSVTEKRDRVLDVGCGRGGDLMKWKIVKARLTAVDPDPESIEEAKRRLEGMSYNADISVGDIRTCPKIQYDIVCYNFSLQYIFANHGLFTESIRAISERVDVGGLLIGTIPDSDKILSLPLKWSDSLGNTVERGPSTGRGLVGEMILVKLVDGPYYKNNYVPEPIAYKSILIEELMKYGFVLINWNSMIRRPTGLISDIYSQFIFRKDAVQASSLGDTHFFDLHDE